MTEYSSKKGARFLQSVIELLVGIPSVVYGFLGLTVIVPFIRNVFGFLRSLLFIKTSYSLFLNNMIITITFNLHLIDTDIA